MDESGLGQLNLSYPIDFKQNFGNFLAPEVRSIHKILAQLSTNRFGKLVLSQCLANAQLSRLAQHI